MDAIQADAGIIAPLQGLLYHCCTRLYRCIFYTHFYRQERDSYGTHTMSGVFRPDKRQGHCMPPLRPTDEGGQYFYHNAQKSPATPP